MMDALSNICFIKYELDEEFQATQLTEIKQGRSTDVTSTSDKEISRKASNIGCENKRSSSLL